MTGQDVQEPSLPESQGLSPGWDRGEWAVEALGGCCPGCDHPHELCGGNWTPFRGVTEGLWGRTGPDHQLRKTK